jgi:beta-mannosidase
MGTLYWQLNDCWPGASWSSIDYKGRWKALHYAAKNFFQPIFISIKQFKNNIEIYGMNDLNHPFKGDVVVQVLDFSGESLSTLKKSIKLKSVSVSKILTFDTGELIDDEKINRTLIRASLYNKIKQLSQNEFYFVRPKDLQIPKPRFDFEYKILNGEVEILIKAHTFIYKAFIICDKSDGLFSENFMDLIPGELKKVKFKTGKKSDNKLEDLTFIMKSYYELVHKN